MSLKQRATFDTTSKTTRLLETQKPKDEYAEIQRDDASLPKARLLEPGRTDRNL